MRDTPRSTDELAQDRTYMAWGRSVMALERTLMARIRTSLSLIGFGFAIFKFLQAMQHGFIMDEGISCSTFANIAGEANNSDRTNRLPTIFRGTCGI